MRFAIHMFLHFAVPAAVAVVVTRRPRRVKLPQGSAVPESGTAPDPWRAALRLWIIMMLTMVVDIDHLLADPLFDPNRCSLGFHPLHTAPAIALYGILSLIPRSRWWGIGLLIHMLLDGIDCLWMSLA